MNLLWLGFKNRIDYIPFVEIIMENLVGNKNDVTSLSSCLIET